MTTGIETVLIVFAKTPVPGRVKTRLISELGAAGAAALYRQLLERTLQTAAQSAIRHIELHCTPTLDDPVLQAYRRQFNLSLHLQQGNDLGRRMHHAFSQVLFNNGAAILIGCDVPGLTAQDLNTAREKLEDSYDAVLGPARDGGYYLIGLRKAHEDLFADIEWGTAGVLAATRSRIHAGHLVHFELDPRADIDRPEDLLEFSARFPGKTGKNR